jgi:hypothetical protein
MGVTWVVCGEPSLSSYLKENKNESEESELMCSVK